MTNLKSAALFSASVILLASSAGSLRAAPDNTLGMAIMSVSASGSTVLHNTGAESITNTSNGNYQVVFSRSILNCVHVGSATNTAGFSDFAPWLVKVRQLSIEPTTVRILTATHDGTIATRPFSLIVFCPK